MVERVGHGHCLAIRPVFITGGLAILAGAGFYPAVVVILGGVGEIAIADGLNEVTLCIHIVGMVAAMTESDPGVASEKFSYNILG